MTPYMCRCHAGVTHTELDLEAEIPRPVSSVVMACLEKDLALRPQSARALAKGICQTVSGRPPAAKDGTTTSGLSRGPGQWLRNWWNGRAERAK